MNNKIKFKKEKKDIAFHQALSKEVNIYLNKHSSGRYVTNFGLFKALLLLFGYIISYIFIYYSTIVPQLYLLYMLQGILTISLALNIGHDAAHGVFLKNKQSNKIFLHIFDLLGANSFIWKNKHIHSHHPHVNIPGLDADIKQTNLVRIFPNSPFHDYHKLQWLYMPILYVLYTLIWLLYRDFKDLYKDIIRNKEQYDKLNKEVFIFYIGKVIYFLRFIILPYVVTDFTFRQILIAFILYHLLASFTVPWF